VEYINKTLIQYTHDNAEYKKEQRKTDKSKAGQLLFVWFYLF